VKAFLDQLLGGRPLSEADAERAFETILSGRAEDAELAALLSLIQVRGASVDELVGAARVMRRHVRRVPTEQLPPGHRLVDTCGTGGAPKTFNVSTGAAIVAAAAGRDLGVHVAKHGNRSRSGRGSAELLERLGVNVNAEPEVQARCLLETGACFSFAIHHHPAMKHAAAVRRSLGFPTIFNLLGPLTNPAGASRQALGVYAPSLVEPMAHALLRLGAERAIVAHGDDGLDEITTTTTTRLAHVRDGAVRAETFDPRGLDLEPVHLADLGAADLDDAAELIRSVLRRDRDVRTRRATDIVALNAAAALIVGDAAADFEEGASLARAAIADGRAEETLNRLAAVSQG